MTQPTIKSIPEKKLIGKRRSMSLSKNDTAEFWRDFMLRRKEIKNLLTGDLISLQVYPPNYFMDFAPTKKFEKWALAEVADFGHIPDDMEPFVLPAGQYAEFAYKGSSIDNSIFHYIYTEWLPSSDYSLDDRPHFEVLGDKYNNETPDSEEEIWIPIKTK